MGLDADNFVSKLGSCLQWTEIMGRLATAVQGFGCRPSTAVQLPPAAGVRKPPRNEPAGIVQRGCRALRYGDLSDAISVSVGAQSCWRRLITCLAGSSS